MIDKNDEVFIAFVEESREHLLTLEEDILGLESEGKDGKTVNDDLVNKVFRVAHSIKGTAAFLALDKVKDVAHAMESLLGLFREHVLTPDAQLTTLLLQGADHLKSIIGDFDSMDAVDTRATVQALRKIVADAESGDAPASSAATPSPVADAVVDLPDSVPVEEPSTEPAELAPSAREAAGAPSSPPAHEAAPPGKNESATVRVSLVLLDKLMTLAGELVLTRNALLKKTTERDMDGVAGITQRVDGVTSELQEAIMATRMQSVGTVFTKFKRIVRDLAQKLGKRVDLVIEGEDVELDRSIIEAISDPLTHLVRNAVDHGLESPARREAAGKKATGRLLLAAAHEAGQVVIEIADDGAGIDPKRIGDKAVEKGIITRAQADGMSAKDLTHLIFRPGFSTASQVTEVSGRGVGMDVVMTNLTKVGGTVDVSSRPGQETRIIIKLPLTLAIIPSILVAVNDERFAIPQINLVELVRIAPRDVAQRVERLGSAAVMRLREELLPLVRLADVLGVERQFVDPASGAPAPERRQNLADRRSPGLGQPVPEEPAANRRQGPDRRVSPQGALNVAVVAVGSHRYGLVVDQLLDSEEIVVKPIGGHLADCREYAGATILGDGSVALILDIAGLREVAGLSSTQTALEDAENKRKALAHGSRDAHTYLVVRNRVEEQFVVPLGMISRIERFLRPAMSEVGGRLAVAYGESMLALLPINALVPASPIPADSQRLNAVVFKAYGREAALLVSEILDIVEVSTAIDSATHLQPGVMGSVVLDGKISLILDVHGFVDQLLPEYKNAKPPGLTAARRVLVVEDSPFFLKQMKSVLTDIGCEVFTAEDGEKGLRVLDEQNGSIAMVFTDVEMPTMDGLEMTRRIRADGRFCQLPVLAVTSLSGDLAEKKGRDAGLTEYLVKLDREQIVDRCNQYLARS
jgi:two-component system chemotaxis sensor kinase CheA